MRAVGIRELKNRLSEFLRLVRGGEEVLVTDRGRVVAELRPPRPLAPESSGVPGVELLASRGVLSRGAPNDADAYPRLKPALPPGEAARLLDEERGPR